MTSLTRGEDPEGQDGREGTPPLTKEQIEGHISAMKSIIKDHNKRNKANPIRLNFKMVGTTREKISGRATIGILTRAETTS
ncbi:hypothetical protein Tco_1487419, partial [Tanacetum coccineum]